MVCKEGDAGWAIRCMAVSVVERMDVLVVMFLSGSRLVLSVVAAYVMLRE